MKKTKLTRSLLAACSIVALSAVMYGCAHDGGDDPAPAADPPTAMDSDGDGVADADDAFPNDATETMDSDGDGIGDNADPHNVRDDRDNDGVADSGDAFPDDPTETRDSDDDGVGDNADAFPLDPDETTDANMNGVGDNEDQRVADENQRVMDVASARMAAMQSYMDADADATKAEAAADMAEADAPDSPGAMAAREAATAARTAANMAKAAHDAIMDDMTKADADAEAEKAANQAMYANSSYMTAKRENDAIQTAAATGDEQNRMRDVMAATSAAGDAATDARAAANAAHMSANAADEAADAAEAAHMRAVAARTDSDAAEMAAMAAREAADAAEEAAMAAEEAAMAAEAARDGIDPAGSGADAEAAQMTAETKQGEAETAQGTASEQNMAAMTASGEAATAAGMHVLRLFQAANGAHVMDTEGNTETADHVMSVGAAMAAIAAATEGNQTASTTATITFPGDTVDDPDTADTDEFAEGMLGITVNVAGTTEIVAEFGADRAADDTVVPAVTARIQTARAIDDLGDFQGYELWEDDGDETATSVGDRARAIVFTNKAKGDDSVLAQTAATARTAENVVVTTDTLTMLGTKSGNTYTGAQYTPTGEAPLTGTLTCPSGTACSVEATTAADGTVTINAVSGYVFTGSREAREEVAAADAAENNNYLAFGLWLEESDDGATDTFGAFAAGSTDYAVNVQNAVTGTATYSGVAAGAHHMTGEGVNWFDGVASLTANFGADDAPGTIHGEISNIRVSGGEAMADSIQLGQAGLTDGQATFNGAAFIGEATAPGASTHEFDGTWSGSFFGATADDTDTTDVNESVTAPLAAAGTFGVTRSEGTGDDMMVESFVGAFGAHLDD